MKKRQTDRKAEKIQISRHTFGDRGKKSLSREKCVTDWKRSRMKKKENQKREINCNWLPRTGKRKRKKS